MVITQGPGRIPTFVIGIFIHILGLCAQPSSTTEESGNLGKYVSFMCFMAKQFL